ncbi:hypothetical protein BDW60DRAFT_149057 [Aspergillus nidulans var. acristatus]
MKLALRLYGEEAELTGPCAHLPLSSLGCSVDGVKMETRLLFLTTIKPGQRKELAYFADNVFGHQRRLFEGYLEPGNANQTPILAVSNVKPLRF